MSCTSSASLDERVGRAIYTARTTSAALKLVTTIFSFSGDEIVWFLPTGLYISTAFSLSALMGVQGGVAPVAPNCMEQCLCDAFGTASIAAALESALKLCFRRPRPPYAAQSKGKHIHSVPGEIFSLPSGHSMRSALMAVWLRHNSHARILLSSIGLGQPSFAALLVWACCVAFSRVAAGRHYPLDCALGLLLGAVVGVCTEVPTDAGTAVLSGWLKTAGGIYVTSTWGWFLAVPKLLPLVRRVIPWVEPIHLGAPYLAFYACFLAARVPTSTEGWLHGSCGAGSL